MLLSLKKDLVQNLFEKFIWMQPFVIKQIVTGYNIKAYEKIKLNIIF